MAANARAKAGAKARANPPAEQLAKKRLAYRQMAKGKSASGGISSGAVTAYRRR